MNYKQILMFLLFLPSALSGAEMNNNSLDFELASESGFIKLTELIKSSDLPAKPTLINFWRYDCPECVKEMQLIAVSAKTLQVITIAVQKPSETLLAPEAVRKCLRHPIVQLYAPTQPSGLLARFGNPKQALPHSVMVNSEREICAIKTGEINQEWLDKAIAKCS